MKANLPLVFSCLLFGAGARAQTLPPVYRHSIGVGLEHVGLDAPDGGGNRYLIRYGRHTLNDRVVFEANVGYLTAVNEFNVFNDEIVYGAPRKRVTLDLTASFDQLKHARHALRLGGGPSVWYRQEQSIESVNGSIGPNGVTTVEYKWKPILKEINYGFNVLVEYEYALTAQLLINGKLKFVSVNKAGQSSIYGFGLGYRFGQ